MKKTIIPPLVIIGALFFIFGFITWLNGTLIPFLKLACELTYAESLLVLFAFYIAYVFLALPSSLILQRTGFKNGMALGLVVMAVGAIVFVPAAQTRSFGLFLTGLFIQGAGLALLQTASNPYASILGPLESAARRISLLGIANKVAGILAPVLIGAVVLKGTAELEQQLAASSSAMARAALLDALAGRVVIPYLSIAAALLVLAWLVRRSSLPELTPATETTAPAGRLTQYPHLMLGVLAMFCYVGAEVIAGDTIIQYGRSQGISLDVARNFTSFTLGAMLVGYVVGIVAIPRWLSQQAALRICAVLGVLFTIAITLTHGYASVLCVALLGLANSLMWPAIFPLSIRGLGGYTERGSALLIMGIGGGAVLPYLYGKTSELLGLQNAYLLLIPCYLYVLFFALKGYAYPVKTPARYAVPSV